MRITLWIVLLLAMPTALAAETTTPTSVPSKPSAKQATGAQTADVPASIRELIQKRLSLMGTSEKIEITPTPLPNLFQVLLGHEVFYMDATGEFLIAGKFTNISTGVDFTEERLKGVRKEAFEDLEGSYISYGRKDSPHRAVVFTDIECGYCRHFHKNMREMNRLGIRVDYVLTPFRGERAYRKATDVWCSKDRNRSLDLAKGGHNLPSSTCLSPLEDNLEIAKLLRVQGTPAVFFSDGTSVGGYMEPSQIKQKALQNQK